MLRTLLTEKSLRVKLKPEDFCQLIKSETEVVLSILKNLQLVYNTHCNNIIDLELGIIVEQCSSKFTTSIDLL